MNAHRSKLAIEADIITTREQFLQHEDQQDLILAGKDYTRLDQLLDEYLLLPQQRHP